MGVEALGSSIDVWESMITSKIQGENQLQNQDDFHLIPKSCLTLVITCRVRPKKISIP